MSAKPASRYGQTICKRCGWTGYDGKGRNIRHSARCLAHGSKTARIIAVVAPDDGWGLADAVRFLADEQRSLSNARSLHAGSMWSEDELAQMRQRCEQEVRLYQRQILQAARQIADILGDDR